MTAASSHLAPIILGAPVSGPKVLSRLLNLADELDLIAPNLDRQFALSLMTNVPVLLDDDLRELARQVLLDAKCWQSRPHITHLAANLTAALEGLSSPDPLYA